jgi:hypothetical protein
MGSTNYSKTSVTPADYSDDDIDPLNYAADDLEPENYHTSSIGTDVLLLETGDSLLLEGGDEILLEDSLPDKTDYDTSDINPTNYG